MSTIASPVFISDSDETSATTSAVRRFSQMVVSSIANSWVCLASICFAVWILLRYACFVGYEGSDDMFYARFAALWNHTPINQWEARLLGNALLRLSMLAFGISEWAAVVPAMLASLTTLATALLACRWLGSIRHAWWAGLLIAILPIDIRNATMISPHPVMVSLMAVGTIAFLFAGTSWKARCLAALCLPLGVIAHYNGSYYVASLLLAALLVDWRRYAKSVLTVAIAGMLIMLGEMLVFHFAYGNFLLSLRLSSPDNLRLTGDLLESRLTLSMIAWSIQQVVVGQPFGIVLLVTTVGTILCYRQLSASLRILALASLMFWLVLNFGSYVPWDYRPFWRNHRFMHPLVLPVAILFATFMVQTAGRRAVQLAGAVSLASCLLMLSLNGTWGENKTISRELLYYALSHQGQQFVTDLHTANEIYVLNGMRTPPNVAGTADFGRTHYLDKSIRLVAEINPSSCDAFLINPLNVERTPSFAAMVEPCLGLLEFETDTRYRALCEWVPLFRGDWAVRKPPAQAYRLRAASDVFVTMGPILEGQDHTSMLDSR